MPYRQLAEKPGCQVTILSIQDIDAVFMQLFWVHAAKFAILASVLIFNADATAGQGGN